MLKRRTKRPGQSRYRPMLGGATPSVAAKQPHSSLLYKNI